MYSVVSILTVHAPGLIFNLLFITFHDSFIIIGSEVWLLNIRQWSIYDKQNRRSMSEGANCSKILESTCTEKSLACMLFGSHGAFFL